MLEYIEELVRMFVSCIQSRVLYPAGHAIVKREEDVFYNKLAGLFTKTKEVVIGIIGNEFVFENLPLYKLSQTLGGFIADLKAKGIEKIVFIDGIDREEMTIFINLASQKIDESKGKADFQEQLSSSGVRHILVEKIYVPQKDKEPLIKSKEAEAKEIYDNSLTVIGEITKDFMQNKKLISREKVYSMVSNLVSGILKNKVSLLILTSIKKHDEHTFVHAINVAILVLVEAESLQLDQEILKEIGLSALLHDVGKLEVSGDILKKAGRLTEKEVDEVHLHPIRGAKILARIENMDKMASVVAFEHHIKYDLTGYPTADSKYRYRPTLASMLTAIADYYDACRSHRSYRKGLPPEDIYKDMMEKSGKDFDPDLLKNFFRIIGVYPSGTLVLLDTQEMGMVASTEAADDISRPQVRLICDANRKKFEQQLVVSLMEKDETSGAFKRTIVRSVNPFDPENAWLIPSEYL